MGMSNVSFLQCRKAADVLSGKRYGVFYLLGCVASAFAGILAFGLMQMAGLQGLNGWSWIFIIEGVITVTIGIIGYFMLVPFPDANPERCWGFLNKREVEFIIARVNEDRGDAASEPFSLVKFLRPATDFKIWGFALIFCCLTTVTYALAYFLPIILRGGMGFSVGAAQCLVAPPFKSPQCERLSDQSMLTAFQMPSQVLSCSEPPGLATTTTSADQ